MVQGLDHVAVNVSDIPRAVTFYRDVLEFRPVDARDPNLTKHFWLGFGAGQALNLTLSPSMTPKALGLEMDLIHSAHLAFVAPELFIEGLEVRLVERVVPAQRSRTGIYFCDPDGNLLEVTCWREASLRDAGAVHW